MPQPTWKAAGHKYHACTKLDGKKHIFYKRFIQTPGYGWKGSMNQGLSICPSILPSFCLEVFLVHQFFLKLSIVLGPCVVIRDRAGFFFKKFVPKNGANGPKIGVFEFFGKFSHKSFLNLIYKKSLYYLKYSCTNFILGKNLVHEIWTEMLLSNQIAGFLNCLYLQNKMMKKPGFLYVDTESQKLKVSLKMYGVSLVKNGCGHPGLRILELAVSQAGIME